MIEQKERIKSLEKLKSSQVLISSQKISILYYNIILLFFDDMA